MVRTFILRAAALAGLAWLVAPASAASFDCSRARAPDEVAVCNNPRLSALDSEMGGLWYAYQKVPLLMGASGARQDDAQAFLQRRRRCGADPVCLTRAYQDRIAALRQRIGDAMAGMAGDVTGAPAPAPAAPSPAALPAPVAASVAGYAPQCRRLGGTLANPARAGVMAADLDGDGALDYVLNPEPLQCRGAATAFCANAGCEIRLHLSRRGYANPISAYGGQPTLVQRQGGTDAEIWVSRDNCRGMRPGNACWAVYSRRGAGGALTPQYQARPQPGS